MISGLYQWLLAVKSYAKLTWLISEVIAQRFLGGGLPTAVLNKLCLCAGS